MRNLLMVLWMSLEHKIIPEVITKSRFYRKWLMVRFYPHLFEHYCVFCRRITDDWWDNAREGWGNNEGLL